jgi:uncharacterized RDD family membrane protein YckC
MLDTIYSIETPEGVELDLRLSGIPARMLAWIIDTFIRFGMYLALSMALAWSGEFGIGLFLILIFLIEWFYPVFFEVISDGMTPGKRAMGIRVMHSNGTPIGWPASITRNLLRFIDFLPLFYVFGIVTMMLNRNFQRLGDLVAGTIVVYREDRRTQHHIPQSIETAPAYALQPNEAQAIVHFAERAEQISVERADELASATGLLIPNNKPPAQTLFGIARWITGDNRG